MILTEGLKKVLKGLEDNYDLISKIESKRIPIFEPFSDSTEQHIDIHAKILGPTKNYYKQLLPRFKDYHKLIIEGEKSRRDKSASNISSVILLFDLNYKDLLKLLPIILLFFLLFVFF